MYHRQVFPYPACLHVLLTCCLMAASKRVRGARSRNTFRRGNAWKHLSAQRQPSPQVRFAFLLLFLLECLHGVTATANRPPNLITTLPSPSPSKHTIPPSTSTTTKLDGKVLRLLMFLWSCRYSGIWTNMCDSFCKQPSRLPCSLPCCSFGYNFSQIRFA